MNDEFLDVNFVPTAHDELHVNLAKRLYDYMKSRGWKRDKHGRGASQFQLLIREHGETEVIRRVNGYITHGITRPVVRCCQDFREQWEWIGDVLKQREVVTRADVSADARRIVRELTDGASWPAKAVAQLPAVVQTSLDNVAAFEKHLANLFRGTRDVVDAARGLACELLDAETVVTNWFRRLHQRLNAFPDWMGELSRDVWHPLHPRVAAVMKRLLAKRGDDDRVWDELVRGL